MTEKRAIAVHACGFKGSDEICDIAKYRLEEAAIIAERMDIKDVIISGGVPYHSESKALLADLMTTCLLDKFPELGLRIHSATACYNSSTDIQDILRIARNLKTTQLFAISSYWHIWALSPLYEYWVKKMEINCNVRCLQKFTVRDTPGKKTLRSYKTYRRIIETSLALGFFPLVDSIINRVHSRRLLGYPFTGCD